MNLADIWNEISRDIDGNLAFPDVLSILNRALDDLTPIAKKEMKKTTDIISTNTYELPDDLHRIQAVVINQVKYEQTDDPSIVGYKIWGDEITIFNGPAAGTVELYYYKKLDHMALQTDEPEIELEFHELLILYAKAQLTKEDTKKRQEWMARYAALKDRYMEFKVRFKRRRGVRITNEW